MLPSINTCSYQQERKCQRHCGRKHVWPILAATTVLDSTVWILDASWSQYSLKLITVANAV